MESFAKLLTSDHGESAVDRSFHRADVLQQICRQQICRGFRFRAACHFRLTEDDPSFSLPVFEEGCILKGKTSIQNRREIADGGFFDLHAGNHPAVAAAPDPGILESAPLPFRTEELIVVEIGLQKRSLSAPVAKQFCMETVQDRMLRITRENVPQAVFVHTESESFDDTGRLFKDKNIQSVANGIQIRKRSLFRKGPAADHEGFKSLQIAFDVDFSIRDLQGVKQFRCHAFGVVECDAGSGNTGSRFRNHIESDTVCELLFNVFSAEEELCRKFIASILQAFRQNGPEGNQSAFSRFHGHTSADGGSVHVPEPYDILAGDRDTGVVEHHKLLPDCITGIKDMLFCGKDLLSADPGDQRLVPDFEDFPECAQTELVLMRGQHIVAPVEIVGNESGLVEILPAVRILHGGIFSRIGDIKGVVVPRQQNADVPGAQGGQVVHKVVGADADDFRKFSGTPGKRMPAGRVVAEPNKEIQQFLPVRSPFCCGIAIFGGEIFRIPDGHHILCAPDEFRPSVSGE